MNEIRLLTETQLLEIVRAILSKPEPLTGLDKVDLERINKELVRRDLVKIAKQHHPSLGD